jgi:dTDP-4-amino-4,6-dideoxygalactose transaminase
MRDITDEKSVRSTFLPPFRHSIGKNEIEEVLDTLNSDWITTGPKTFHFENLFKDYVGAEHAIALSSCTAALHLSLEACGIGKNDEVITSPLTFASTAEVIIHKQAKPVFADIDERTYNINPTEIEENISPNTKAIIPVHYAGQPCEMDAIKRIAHDHDLFVIEDAAHAIESSYHNQKIGNIGDLTCFSFYATKNLTTAEGGMITTSNTELAEKIRMLSLHGISKDAWKRYSSKGSWFYEILYAGYKYNMTDLQASIGIHQLKKIESMHKRRQEISKLYNESFKDVPELIIPLVKDYVKHAWHLYPLLIRTEKLKITRSEFIEALKKDNIGTSVHFIPLHLHPYYQKNCGFQQGDFPNTESVYQREISLPIYPKLDNNDVNDVITAVKKIINKYRA